MGSEHRSGERRAPVKAVLFDLDGTLYVQRPLRLAMAIELAASSVLEPGTVRRRLRVLRTYRRVHEELRGAPASDSVSSLQLARTAERTGISVAEVSRIVDEWMQKRPLKYLSWCRRRAMLRTLDQLRAAGLRLGVLSDYPAQDKLTALGVASYFCPVLCTTDREINALKPDPRGFRRACDVWGLQPEEVLYVGDRPEVDGAGASAAGLPWVIVGVRRGGSGEGGRRARGFAALGRRLVAVE